MSIRTELPVPPDYHPRTCVCDFSQIDYGFERDGRRDQVQIAPPYVLDQFGGWAVLLIPVWRDVGAGRRGPVTSRLEWHLDRWRTQHGVWRRESTFVLRHHQLEAIAGAWWSEELAECLRDADDFLAMRAKRGRRRPVHKLHWSARAAGNPPSRAERRSHKGAYQSVEMEDINERWEDDGL